MWKTLEADQKNNFFGFLKIERPRNDGEERKRRLEVPTFRFCVIQYKKKNYRPSQMV